MSYLFVAVSQAGLRYAMGVKMKILYMIIIYLLIINITGFAAMGIDKRRAVTRRWRIKEKTLFFLALIGGSAGSIAGMYFFHHKTKHFQFIYGMPILLIFQILLIVYLLSGKNLLFK